MRVFNLKSTSGSFEATEVLNPGRSEHTTPYPILQSQLYSADQPGKNSIRSDKVFVWSCTCHVKLQNLLQSWEDQSTLNQPITVNN